LTGRSAPQALLDAADVATEMKLLKHAYEKGVPAQPGLDY
jgi:cob(I)alamin adenosyltransferase